MKVVVLGASGMLGSMVLSWLARDRELSLTATLHSPQDHSQLKRIAPASSFETMDAGTADAAELAALLEGATGAVNCIGVIKPYIKDDNAAQVERATRINSLFPHVLAAAAERTNCRVLQIATDCVYSGATGAYAETAAHDALDVYGKSKSMGEVHSPFVSHLRCSIIGPELRAHVSLLDWFLGQSQGAQPKGYSNHQWNGITTLHFARICGGVIKRKLGLPHLQHVIPAGTITKAELLRCFAEAYRRTDIQISPTNADVVIDRTLRTNDAALNREIWQAAGYEQPPSILQMVREMAGYSLYASEASGAS